MPFYQVLSATLAGVVKIFWTFPSISFKSARKFRAFLLLIDVFSPVFIDVRFTAVCRRLRRDGEKFLEKIPKFGN